MLEATGVALIHTEKRLTEIGDITLFPGHKQQLEQEVRILESNRLVISEVLKMQPASSPIDNADQIAERLREIEGLLPEIEAELAKRGTGNLPRYAIMSDFHGGLIRFNQFLSEILSKFTGFTGELNPMVSIEQQLNEQGKSLVNLEGHILFGGDIVDRGDHGRRVAMMIGEVVEKSNGKASFVMGNHDIWAYLNLSGVHLPTYKGFDFHGDRKAEEIIAAYRISNPELFDNIEARYWWTERLAEYNADQTRYQEEWQDKNIKEIRKQFIGKYQQYKAQWNDAQLTAWEDFTGHFARISVPTPYVGLNGVGKTSGVWWQQVHNQLMEGKQARSEAGIDAAELLAWNDALALANQIHREITNRSTRAIEEEKWWYSIFESINTQAYDSVEWWAKDWSSHAGWGESIFREINQMIDQGTLDEAELNQSNYIQSPSLTALRDFYHANFNLYYKTSYGDLFTHGWFPIFDDGSIHITYKGTTYTGTDIYTALDAMSADIKDPTKSLSEKLEAYKIVNSWYADKSTRIKPANIKHNIEKISISRINSGIGVRHHLTGHNPVTRGKLGVPFMVRDGEDYASFEIDFGMAPKYGGQGGFTIIDRDGIQFHGFEHNYERLPQEPLTAAPSIYDFDKDDKVVRTLKSPGLPAVDFHNTAKKQLTEERVRLTAKIDQGASSPVSEGRVKPIILLVDDNDSVRISTEMLLKSQSFNVITAANGVEALRLMREEVSQIAMVITDFEMPEMGGAELAEALNEEFPQIPVVIYSGHFKEKIVQELQSRPKPVKVAGILEKPIVAEDIKKVFERDIGPKNLASSPVGAEGSYEVIVGRVATVLYRIAGDSFTSVFKYPELYANTLLKIFVGLEDEFDISITNDEMDKITRVTDVFNLVWRKGIEQVLIEKQLNKGMVISVQDIQEIAQRFSTNYNEITATLLEDPGYIRAPNNGIKILKELYPDSRQVDPMNKVRVHAGILRVIKGKLRGKGAKNGDMVTLESLKKLGTYYSEDLLLQVLTSLSSEYVLVEGGPLKGGPYWKIQWKDDSDASSPVIEQRATSNKSQVGGIDLNPALMDLQIKRDGNGIPLPFNLQPAEIMNIEGFIPVIINVTPVLNVPLLLGFDMPDTNDKPYDSADSEPTSSTELGFVDRYRHKYIRQYHDENINI